IESYYKDLKRMSKVGLKYFNFHPGSCPSYEEGISNISNGINELQERTNGDDTVILIETMMKKGNYIGKKFEEVAEIISKVKDKSRVGVTIDTCHIWDAGYDLSDADKVLEEFDKVIGLKYLKAIHVNDSKNELGSNKDRHEQIGQGHIGLDNLKKFVNHPKIKNLPKVLETPYKEDNLKMIRRNHITEELNYEKILQ
ncbi:MAG: deoxyribonuclease IV, partial [Mycoplasmataceae bacterium]|nr:deoxyribonuclease IV [Mycoplasmataceae bacterium]